LGNAAIVRNRAKIEATLANARAVVRAREAGEPFADLVWSLAPPRRPPVTTLDELPAATTESKALSKVLKARGFRFVGPTTAYALMEACGLVNNHLKDCFVRADVEGEQAAARARLQRGEEG
jgi:DNA-3-methyladenine glycosylase I